MRTYDEREMQVYLAEQVREMLDERTPRPTSRRGVLRKMAGWILLVLLTAAGELDKRHAGSAGDAGSDAATRAGTCTRHG